MNKHELYLGRCRTINPQSVVLGIDASLTSTGLAITGPGQIETGKLLPKVRGIERLVWLRKEATNLIADRQPDLVVVEDYAYKANNKAHQTGEWGGVLRLLLHDWGVRYAVVAPAKVKKFATGKGNCNKVDIVMELYKRHGLDIRDHDEADASVLAIMGLYLLDRDPLLNLKLEPETKFQAEALDGITIQRQGVRTRIASG